MLGIFGSACMHRNDSMASFDCSYAHANDSMASFDCSYAHANDSMASFDCSYARIRAAKGCCDRFLAISSSISTIQHPSSSSSRSSSRMSCL
jgi:hypothetical protein